MTIPDPNYAGYSEAAATVFTWLANKVLGGAKKALGWGWTRSGVPRNCTIRRIVIQGEPS
jgi:hypothetical protein